MEVRMNYKAYKQGKYFYINTILFLFTAIYDFLYFLTKKKTVITIGNYYFVF